jgi:diguanylate cyclase (GGDEF)-like protein
MPQHPRPSHVLSLVAGMVVYAAVTSWLTWPAPGRSITLAALMLAAVAAALPAVQPLARDWPNLRLSSVPELIALLLFGPQLALVVVAAGLAARALTIGGRQAIAPFAVRGVAAVVSLLAAGAVLNTLGGAPRLEWPWLVLPLFAVTVTHSAVISAAVTLLLPRLEKSVAEIPWREWPQHFVQHAPVHLVGASAAIGVAELIARAEWMVLALASIPLAVAYVVYERQATNLEQHAREIATGEQRAAELSAQARHAAELRREVARLRLAAAAANDGLWEWDLTTGQFFATARWKMMVGLRADARVHRAEDWLDRVHADDRAALDAALADAVAPGAEGFRHEHRIRHEDGTYRVVVCRGVAARSAAGEPTRLAGSLTDTTDLANTQTRLWHAVNRDPLTGMSNRAVLVEQLRLRLEELHNHRPTGAFALLYLDLDRFKVINDSLGHQVGDELLVAVSTRLASCLREGDVLARLGGDEFAILLNRLQTEQQANVVAFRLQEALARPFAVGGREVYTSVSIGIAFGAAQYSTPDEMMHDADTAMYQAKANGKARHEIFDADMDARARDRLGLENDLRRAVIADEFETHYQPIVLLATGMCVGFEALLRWTRDGKPVSPATFVPIAEELGLIERLGARVLDEACHTFGAWQQAFPDAGLECITVNVSCRQLMQHNFLRIVERAVERARIEPAALRIEITETALMTNPDVAARVLSDLRDFGAKIYLDDFGTGYSSLSHLHKLPVDALKIDRSFVRSLSLPDRPAIVESILALARTLHTNVVAEGIETELQASELERLGCTHAQGYLFSRPVPAAAVEELLAARKPLRAGAKPPSPLPTLVRSA